MKSIDNILFKHIISIGEKSSVNLVNYKDKKGEYICEVYEREIEGTNFMKYLKNHINFLQKLSHPNIIKFYELKKTESNFYIIYEYCNGGDLLSLFKKYYKKYNHPFSQEIIQHLMRQIIAAFKYIHKSEIIHGNINLENILIHFENQEDKEKLNMMKAIVKIDDFRYSFKKSKSDIKNNVCGFDLFKNLAIKKSSRKEDIYDIGIVCYSLIFGNLAKKNISITLSKEILSFLKGMIKSYSYKRLSIEQLADQDFITKDVKNFELIEPKVI